MYQHCNEKRIIYVFIIFVLCISHVNSFTSTMTRRYTNSPRVTRGSWGDLENLAGGTDGLVSTTNLNSTATTSLTFTNFKFNIPKNVLIRGMMVEFVREYQNTFDENFNLRDNITITQSATLQGDTLTACCWDLSPYGTESNLEVARYGTRDVSSFGNILSPDFVNTQSFGFVLTVTGNIPSGKGALLKMDSIAVILFHDPYDPCDKDPSLAECTKLKITTSTCTVEPCQVKSDYQKKMGGLIGGTAAGVLILLGVIGYVSYRIKEKIESPFTSI